MKLPMFVGATEARDAPFVGVRVEVAPRAGAGPEAVPHAPHADVELAWARWRFCIIRR